MLLSDTRFAIRTSTKTACSSLKRATSGVFCRVQQKLGHRTSSLLPITTIDPQPEVVYQIADMFIEADKYTSGTGKGMMRLFGSWSPMRSKLCGFFINIVQSYGYRLNCFVVALQILDRFLTNTTVSDVKECIYHYAFVSMMIAVEEVHGFPMTAKRFEHHVGERCSSRTIKRYKKEIMKTLMGVVSVATTTDLLMATLQVAAYKYPLEFAASDMFERIDRIRRNELPLEPRPFLFDFNLFVDPCSLAIAVACDQQCQKISGPKLASACFYVLVEEATDLDLDMLDGCALYSYKEVAAIASYIKKFVKSA